MLYLPALAMQLLRDRGVLLDPGLTDEEVARVEERVGFNFGKEHRDFLQEAVPIGQYWPDWRNGSTEDLRGQIDWPLWGILPHAADGSFWPAAWGERPASKPERESAAREHLDKVPRLVPLYSHRYLTVDPIFAPSPVFSCHETDVITFADDLLDWAAQEFHMPPRHESHDSTYVPFWSEISADTGWELGPGSRAAEDESGPVSDPQHD